MKYFLCLGSNLGQKGRNLKKALAMLKKEGIRIIRLSSLYQTEPVEIPGQSWFYNQVAEVEASLSPLELLKLIKKIEQRMGRKDSLQKTSRKIDIDILLAGEKVVRTRKLVIPHPRLERRNFALLPLSEIAPDVVHPVLKAKIKDLAKKSGDSSVVRKIE
ncbi:hypothetical protein AMJ44_13290 [candidate division WOR-1 bacterium DG_54_3]|jgi:2-amino-4-hydroxy-6-hydroxymethyldihydropteridine diphosphokinase|uniref:2-amino-4-hydroxy-6-hydroxymethyldihydropteridine diphosphokinase n=1 Tax=candidate division WOR-1 bacterium DG_54_3 TaxID=1703775 RepID=A0A0S7XNU2_UNCSA|nr:MAG: hypothetical protein AMJ44_13290 [candidate division WOR-1 bacterium DG_54_3]